MERIVSFVKKELNAAVTDKEGGEPLRFNLFWGIFADAKKTILRYCKASFAGDQTHRVSSQCPLHGLAEDSSRSTIYTSLWDDLKKRLSITPAGFEEWHSGINRSAKRADIKEALYTSDHRILNERRETVCYIWL